jgi:hypothetical protein
VGLCVLAGVAPGVAGAWDGPSHSSIVLAAARVSSAADKRIPVQFRDAFFQAIEQGDFRDTNCLAHRGPHAKRDAAEEAQRLLGELTGPNAEERPYHRATLLGRFLHYVADSAVPNSLAAGTAVAVADFFSNKNFVVFREKQEIKAPIAASLRALGGEAQWAQEGLGGESAVFRLAVNLTVDALLLASRSGAAGEEPGTAVLFVINPLDNGTGMTRSEFYHTTSYLYAGPMVFESNSFGERRVGGGGSLLPDLLQRAGVQVVEWRGRREGPKLTVRALFFNNQARCASDIVIGGHGPVVAVTGVEMPPFSLRQVVLEIPADGEPREPFLRAVPRDCSAADLPPGFVSTRRRLAVAATGAPPRFEGEITEINVTPEPAPRRPALRR